MANKQLHKITLKELSLWTLVFIIILILLFCINDKFIIYLHCKIILRHIISVIIPIILIIYSILFIDFLDPNFVSKQPNKSSFKKEIKNNFITLWGILSTFAIFFDFLMNFLYNISFEDSLLPYLSAFHNSLGMDSVFGVFIFIYLRSLSSRQHKILFTIGLFIIALICSFLFVKL